MIDLTGKTAFVTGGGVGIGKAVCVALAEAGADVALSYYWHDGSSVASTIGALGRRSAAFQLDATEGGNVERIVGLAADALGGHIDILVNNVGGLVANKTLDEMDDAYWHEVMEVNLSSAFFCTRAALKYMGSGGRIVSISSLAALNGGRGSVAYASAKAGVCGFTRALAKELGSSGITVNAIAPGLILGTPFHATFTPPESQAATVEATPLKRPGEPEDCAGAVLYLASTLGSFVTGAVIDVNGGLYFS
jgi:3-oxoacyl-[acyl-carrier protein] reductase